MKRKLTFPLVGLPLILLSASCEKIDSGANQEQAIALESIPGNYGALKAVTMTERYPDWAQLWFQDDAGTINMVRVNWVHSKMMKQPLTLTRTQAAKERSTP